MPGKRLKPGWTRVAFGEMATSVTERVDRPAESGVDRYVGLEHLEPDSLRIQRWGAPTDVFGTKLRFRKGDIVFGRRRAYQRKLAVAHFDGICSAHALVLRALPGVVLPEFLPFFMQSEEFMARAQRISVGSLSPTINWKMLEPEEFALPPLPEQRRMANLLAHIDLTSHALQKTAQASQRLQAAMFTRLVGDSDAACLRLGSLLSDSPRNGCSAVVASRPTGHWVLALNALSKWGYRGGALKPVHKTKAMRAALLRPGDLLISRSNTRELVGLSGVFAEERNDVSYPDTMMRLRPNSERLHANYLELFLRSPNGRRQIRRFAAGTSASMKKINGDNVKKIMVVVPEPREQAAIVSRVAEIGRPLETVRSRLTEIDNLRKLLNRTIS